MRSSVSPKQGSDRRLNNSRTRKRHKRLDAICEETYNRNRGLGVEQNVGNRGMAAACVEAEPRRSTRARRPPVMLDASPPPAKKRRKIGKNGERINNHVERVKEESSSKGHHSPDASSGDAEEPDSWRSRLRSRVSGRSFGMEKRESPRGKRKLVKDLEGVKEEPILKDRELDEKKGGMDGGKLTVMYSRRPGRIKATNVLRHEDKEIELITSRGDDSGRKEVEMTEANGEERPLALESVSCGGNDREADDGDNQRSDRQEVGGVRTDVQFECTYTDNVETVERTAKEPEHVEVTEEGEKEIDSVEAVEKTDKEPEQLEGAKEGEKEIDSMEAVGFTPMQVEARGSCDCGNASNVKFHKNPAEDDTVSKMEEANHVFVEKIWKLQMKEGRRCGLCGGASDGKPPKRLVHDMAESDNEACSGSSASEEPNYDIWDGFGDEPSWLGRLLGPINDRFGIAGTWVHQHCAVWSPEVYFSGLGCLKNIRAALCRGRGLKCNRCGRSGATTGCRVDRCPKTYHLPCARANGCHFDHRKFLIACTDHRHVFQPHGNRYLDRIKKMKARKMKLEVRKLSNDALRKDVEAEEKWLENCGEDEEFLRRESKRLHRDILRIAPVYIGGPTIESENLFQGWDSVAGLQDVVRCMKEVVILPLLYPEFFDNMGLTPPRGVLLHGYPGTGKTLVVRALIGSCARGDKRIAYFARKGADCLGKYVGDAERQLRLLFQVAEKSQPSIIFFDEIDGLAPRRTRQQDQTHSSVVSTLLALLDGLKSRGSVVVIGATNRPEAVDPALRRPGRFDREIYFPLPSLKDRAAILSLHTQRWPKPVSGSLLQWIARQTAGFAGADLQALCTQVAMVALKRNRPLQEILSAAGEKSSNVKRRPLPNFVVEERDWLEALACVPIPCSRREAGMAANDVVSSPLHMHLVPCLLQPLSSLLISLYLDDRIWLPPPLSKAAAMIKEVIFSALEKKKIPDYYWWSHVQDMLQEIDVAREIEKGLSCAGILMGEASFSLSDPLNGENGSSLMQNMALPLGKKLGYRILIAGSPKSGQRHVASFLLHYLFGDVEIQKVDLATISQEGRGDIVQGITQILMKCSSVRSSVVFMPRIDLWALHQEIASVETDSPSSDPQSSVERNSSRLEHSLVSEKNNSSIGASKSTDAAEMEAAPRASHAWKSFIEQVDSLCVSTSLIILATSEVPYPKLPPRVRQLFKSDILYFSHSASSRGTTPHFVVQIDGNFNHDMVISSSTAELAKDLIQLFVQLTHDRTHNVGSCWESKVCNTIEDTARHGIEDESGNEPDNRVQLPEDSAAEAPFPPYNRPVKGKSNLLLAITTFGYQILLYPHFAELCWVTSKLKEGPCTDTNGPWKGWPFNTCIVRPTDSLVRAAVVSGSGNIKSKEKSGLVRGLIAVGLSAYRGVYASLREVASEVRKVLELLVGQINTKIQAGKDRCQFIRILSQVAYLEDVVNSWVYTLQSLEQGAQTAVGNPKVASLVCPDNVRSCIGAIQSVGSMPDVPNGGSRVQNEQIEGSATVDSQCGYLEKVDADSISPYSKVTPAIAEESPNSGGKIYNKQIDINFESCPLDNTRKPALPNGNCAPLKSSEGSGHTESVVLSKDGLFSLYDLGAVKLPTSKGAPEKLNGLLMAENGSQSKNGAPSPDDHDMNISSSPTKTTSLSADSEVVCLYCCCAGCLNTLHSLIQKILVREWEMNGNHWTVDGVHDVVTSLSVYLLSEVRKLYGTRSFSSSIDEKLRHEKDKEKLEHQAADACGCKNSGNSRAELMECGCHLLPTPSIFQLGNVLKFIYRNGVLLPVNSDEDVPLHCKFERLCLCTLIEWILWIKKPSD